MSNQDVVLPDMGIAAAAPAAALPGPGRALFACRGAAGALSSLRRGAYGGLGLPGGAGGEPFLGARTCCTSRVVETIRASSPTRSPAVDECDAWTVSCVPVVS